MTWLLDEGAVSQDAKSCMGSFASTVACGAMEDIHRKQLLLMH